MVSLALPLQVVVLAWEACHDLQAGSSSSSCSRCYVVVGPLDFVASRILCVRLIGSGSSAGCRMAV